MVGVPDGDCGSTLIGLGILPSTYPSSPLDLSSWVIVVVHFSKLSPLNFCSSEKIVKVGIPENIVADRGNYLDALSKICLGSGTFSCHAKRFFKL